MIRTTLDGALIADVVARIAPERPPSPVGRQPVHTCYVPADKLTPNTPREWGDQALAALDEHGALLDMPRDVLARVRAKLEREPVEDLRIDFEDGYGIRDDAIEDDHVLRAAMIVKDWHQAGISPPWCGIRFKSFFTPALLERGVRTLDIYLTTLAGQHPGLRLTLPKVTSTQPVAILCDLLEPLEERLGLPADSLRFEIQIETTESIMDMSGRLRMPRLITTGRGRVSGLHFGTYDYTAACGLDAAQQSLDHPACDFARHVMQLSAAGTGVQLSDGSTNLLPVGDAVELGWRTHYRLVRRSLEHGFYQGWDLHPAQLVTRYAAVYTYYQDIVPRSAQRLGAYLAGRSGSVADEPATARALAGTLRRAVDCGALSEAEVTELVGNPDWRAHV
jgi:citrate lyase beta subunit